MSLPARHLPKTTTICTLNYVNALLKFCYGCVFSLHGNVALLLPARILYLFYGFIQSTFKLLMYFLLNHSVYIIVLASNGWQIGICRCEIL